MIKISRTEINSLKSYIEKKLELKPCDHSLRFAKEWAGLNNFDLNDLVDILEENGGFCDCEVRMNLPEKEDLIIQNSKQNIDNNNPWKLPKDYILKEKFFTKVLISNENCKGNCYAKNGEILIPAPFGAKSKKRTRKLVHFFIGLKSGLPNEYGYVNEIKSITAQDFAKQVRNSKQKDLFCFTEKEADFYLSSLDNLKAGTPVGTHFTEKSGLTGKGETTLKIHKIF